MRRFYITTPATCRAHARLFHRQTGWHGINLSDGSMVIAVEFATELAQDDFETLEDVVALPDAMLEGNVKASDAVADKKKKFGAKHLALLAELGVDPNDNVLQISEKLSVHNPLVRLRHTP